MKRLKRHNKMKVVYALEEFPNEYTKSIFLAGPTPRNNAEKSWRVEAISILEKLGYDGVVFVPEQKGKFKDYSKQIEWETEGLNRADCIIFWINRELREDFENIGLTTNIEWGKWSSSGKVVIGFPDDSPRNKYIRYNAKELGLKVNKTLNETISNALSMIGNGSYRKNGECYVPLHIWKSDEFQNWYISQIKVGNELKYAKVNYSFFMPRDKKLFLWVLHVHVYIKDEDRIKKNEFILSRTNTYNVVLYKKGRTIDDTQVVLVREFRSPSNNDECFVYEIPGGSSTINDKGINVIKDEVYEELGVKIQKDRFNFIESRQDSATLCIHKAHLYSVELSDDEFNEIKEESKFTHGVKEDSELTYIVITTLKEILSKKLLDWQNIGKIFRVLYKVF